MATKKKPAAKRSNKPVATRAASTPATGGLTGGKSVQTMVVLFTLLSLVFLVLVVWRYY